MANTKSAQKELRKSKKRNEYNKNISENVKTMIKKTKKAILSKDQAAEKMTKDTMKAIDKAKQKGVIKKNTGNRKKSRLHKMLNKNMAS